MQRFLSHIERRRAKPAWEALSDGSRQALRARHADLARAAHRAPSDDPNDILFGELQLRTLGTADSVVVVGPLGDRVRLRVTVPDGPSAEIWMVREGSVWKVDLDRSLAVQPAVTQAAETTEPSTENSPPGEGRPDTSTPSVSNP